MNKKRMTGAFVAAVLSACLSAQAEPFVWSGAAGNNPLIANPDNWVGGAAPTFAPGVEIEFASEDPDRLHNVTLGADRTVGIMHVNSRINPVNDLEIRLSQQTTGGADRTWTFEGASGQAALSIAADVTRDVTFGDGTWGRVVLASDLVVNHSGSGTVYFNRPVDGVGSLTKTGSGEMVLLSAGSYYGGTTVSGGTLVGDVAGAFGFGSITVDDEAILVLRSPGTLAEAASLVLAPDAALDLDYSGEQKVSGVSLDGGGTWLGEGTYSASDLELLGEGSYSGDGALVVDPVPVYPRAVWTGGGANNNWGNSDNWLDENPPDEAGIEAVFSAPGAGRVNNNIIGADRTIGFLIVDANATDDVGIALRNPQSTLHRTLTFEVPDASAGIAIMAGVSRNVSIVDDMGQVHLASDLLVNHAGSGLLSIARPIEGSGSVTLTGSGAMALGAANSYSGGTTVMSGTLTGNAAGALGTGDVAVEGGTLRLQSGEAIHPDATLVLDEESTLDLDFAGVQTVSALSLDGGASWLADASYSAGDLEAIGAGTYMGDGSITVESVHEPFSVESRIESGQLILTWPEREGRIWTVWSTTSLLEPFEVVATGVEVPAYTNLMTEAAAFFRVSEE